MVKDGICVSCSEKDKIKPNCKRVKSCPFNIMKKMLFKSEEDFKNNFPNDELIPLSDCVYAINHFSYLRLVKKNGKNKIPYWRVVEVDQLNDQNIIPILF